MEGCGVFLGEECSSTSRPFVFGNSYSMQNAHRTSRAMWFEGEVVRVRKSGQKKGRPKWFETNVSIRKVNNE
jgi:hypothetical protein